MHFIVFLLYHNNFGSDTQSYHDDGELLSLAGNQDLFGKKIYRYQIS